ncbi:cellulose binding domain-containing protein [Jidongwangia harbinensis]|uniref:cellulose binding domain-containing protein n=1 Tax=Jidongwangia harbinensis TaxID=2878561 RepID=UPI001CDA44AE|nr:cellulose binding domain-containing protein [Jidongwangia harbinensis]MCA2217807.1 cellulose binding domain-containing protein [Jidongwangia harbinensis]
MSDAPRRERRSPMVMLLDAAMRLAVAAQSGPQPRLEAAGRPRRAGMVWLVAGAVLAVAGTGVVVGTLLTGRDDLASLPPHATARAPVADAAPSAPTGTPPVPSATRPAAGATASATSPAPGVSTTAPRPGGTGTGPGSGTGNDSGNGRPAPPAPAPPAPVPLTASYEFADGGTGLLGYAADVAVSNPGAAGRDGWQLTLTLPRPTLQIAKVSGAVASQDGSTWTFEPDETTRTVPAGGSVRISFQVRGATLLAAAPEDCRIDGRPCAGVGGAALPG